MMVAGRGPPGGAPIGPKYQHRARALDVTLLSSGTYLSGDYVSSIGLSTGGLTYPASAFQSLGNTDNASSAIWILTPTQQNDFMVMVKVQVSSFSGQYRAKSIGVRYGSRGHLRDG